jgi:hypothetical protein
MNYRYTKLHIISSSGSLSSPTNRKLRAEFPQLACCCSTFYNGHQKGPYFYKTCNHTVFQNPTSTLSTDGFDIPAQAHAHHVDITDAGT